MKKDEKTRSSGGWITRSSRSNGVMIFPCYLAIVQIRPGAFKTLTPSPSSAAYERGIAPKTRTSCDIDFIFGNQLRRKIRGRDSRIAADGAREGVSSAALEATAPGSLARAAARAISPQGE